MHNEEMTKMQILNHGNALIEKINMLNANSRQTFFKSTIGALMYCVHLSDDDRIMTVKDVLETFKRLKSEESRKDVNASKNL